MGKNGLQLKVLGGVTVFEGGRRIEVPGSRKTRALLGYLLLQDRPVTREHLCEMLWPHPDNPRAALRWSLTKLRPVLNAETEHLKADRTSVAVEGLDDGVDLRRVDRLLKKPLDQVGTADLEACADLFHGELLEGLEIPDCHRFNEWLVARAEAARRSHRTILETLTSRHADDPDAALVHARARVALDPLDEGAHVDVVRLLAALGRSDEARTQVDKCRRILETELGVQPGPGIEEALAQPRVVVSEPHVTRTSARIVPAPSSDAGLFGRAEECARIEHFIAPANGRPILYLDGEPGIGKSRLLAELRRRAEARNILVLEGRSWEVGMVRPFGVWIDLLAGLHEEAVPENLREDLAPLMPSLGQTAGTLGELEPLVTAVRGLFDHCDREGRTIFLMFDDLHWIDRSSAELLTAVLPSEANRHVGIACAGRRGEFADNEAARALLRTWNRLGRLDRIAVGPLGDGEAAALVRSLGRHGDVDDDIASCGGNPLYLIETTREAESGRSGGVAAVVADRLDVLEEASREIAEWAALLGHAFPAARMVELMAISEIDVARYAESLERHGILLPRGGGWDFAHDLLRAAALARLSGPRRTLMHRRIARVMATESDPNGALAGEIFVHAARGGDPALAVPFAVAAGDRALKLAAFEDAWKVADHGLVEYAKLPADETIESRVALLRILVLAGLGRRRGEFLVRELDQAAARAHDHGLHAVEREARWLLSVVTEEAGDLDAARRHSLGAEKAGRAADARTRLQALANTGRCLVQLEREPDRAANLLQEAHELSASLGIPTLDIPWGLGLLHTLNGNVAEARTALAEGASMAAAEDNHWAEFECRSRLSMLDLADGDLDAVEGRDAKLRALADKLGEGSEGALAGVILALARRKAGDEAADLEQALATLRAADSKGLLAWALNESARLDHAEENVDSAAARAREAMVAAQSVGRHRQYQRAKEMLKMADPAATCDDHTMEDE